MSRFGRGQAQSNRTMFAAIIVVLFVFAGLGCSSHSDEETKGSSDDEGAENAQEADYSIKAYVTRGKGPVLTEFGPVDAVERHGYSTKSLLLPRTTGAIDRDGGDPGDMHDWTEQEVAEGKQPGWLLLQAALGTCIAEAPVNLYTYSLVGTDTPDWGLVDQPGAWDSRWFMIGARIPSSLCEMRLQVQDLLLCAAGKLEAASSTVDTVRWTVHYQDERKVVAHPENEFIDTEEVTYIIPPQATEDQFILRDLAIATLAQLARLDLEPAQPIGEHSEEWVPGWTSYWGNETCEAQWAAVLDDPTSLESTDHVCAASYWAEISGSNQAVLTLQDKIRCVQQSMRGHTHVLRASGRLLRRLLDDSFYADLAGAERNRAAAGDPSRGVELMWGVHDSVNGSYSSLRHALRLLYGRWELGPNYALEQHDPPVPPVGAPEYPHDDPMCSRIAELDLLPEAVAAGFDARWKDRSVETSGQALALSTLMGSGIVLPPDAYARSAIDDARGAIARQLLFAALETQWSNEDPLDPDGVEVEDFAKTPAGRAVAGVLDDISDEDFRFALDRVFGLFRYLTNQNAGLATVSGIPGANLRSDERVAQDLLDMGGGVLDGGFPRHDLTADVTATLGRAQSASQCAPFALTPLGGPEPPVADWWAQAANDVYAPFQNAFLLGDTFRSRLAAIADVEQAPEDVTEMAELASAELRSWTGPGRVVVHWEGRTIKVRLYGFSPADLGYKSVRELRPALRLVYGEPWRADCVAGVRDSCTGAFASDGTPQQTLDPVEFEFAPGLLPGATETPGYYGKVLEWTFEFTVPEYLGEFYVVATRSKRDDKEPGRVLSAFRGYCGRGVNPLHGPCAQLHSIEIVSEYQRELANKAFAVGARWPEYADELDSPSTADPATYCIRDVTRSVFAPLENELSSDSDRFEDSWKHYLDLGDLAAQRADSLAREIIELGGQQELRREAAGFDLGQTCGDFTSLGSLEAEEGQLVTPEDSSQLSTCLAAPRYDLVFASRDPYPNEVDATDKIKEHLLGCNDPETTNPLCKKDEIAYTALGISPIVSPDQAESCDQILAAFSGDAFPGAVVASEAVADYASAAKQRELLGSYRVQVYDDQKGWLLTTYGAPFMGTLVDVIGDAEVAVYPGCACPESSSTCDPTASACDELGQQLSAVFPVSGTVGRVQAMFDVRRQVEGVLWLLGSLAGEIPRGVFAMSVPAINRAEYTGDADVPLPAPAFYGRSRFVEAPGGDPDELRLQPDATIYDKDVVLMGPARRLRETDARLYLDSSVPLSPWHGWLLQDALQCFAPGSDVTNEYVSVRAENGAILFNSPKTLAQYATELGSSTSLEGLEWDDTVKPLYDWHKAVPTGLGCDTFTITAAASGGWMPGFNSVFRARETSDPLVEGDADQLIPMWDRADGGPFNNGVSWGLPPKGNLEGWKSEGFACLSQCSQLEGEAFPNALLPPACAQTDLLDCYVNESQQTSSFVGYYGPGRLSLPQACPPDGRLAFFVSHGPGENIEPTASGSPLASDIAKSVTRGLALSCLTADRYVSGFAVREPPPVRTEADITRLHSWLTKESFMLQMAMASQVFRGMPEAVAENSKVGATELQEYKGTQGQTYLKLQQDMEGLMLAWQSAQAQFAQIASMIAALQVELRLIRLQGQRALNQNELTALSIDGAELGLEGQLLELDRQQALNQLAAAKRSWSSIGSAISFASSGASGDFGGMASAVYDWALTQSFGASEESINRKYNDAQRRNTEAQRRNLMDQMNIVEDNGELIVETTDTELQLAVAHYAVESAPAFERLSAAVSQISSLTMEVKKTLLEIDNLEDRANYQAAQGAGADYFTRDGQPVKLPVNTVLRRQYDAARLRYDQALADAKRLAYMARLGIEQRIGMRLNAIDQPIGSLEPPALWCDDVCSLQGVDYEALRDYDTEGGDEADQVAIENFSDQFVGDYIAKLRNFMEFYNAVYPFHEADDVAVLSLRDDLMVGEGACFEDARNMLLHSDDLWLRAEEQQGWVHRSCELSGVKCLVASPAEALEDTGGAWLAPLPPGAVGGVTWLQDLELPGPAPSSAATPPDGPVPPRATVSQPVHLEAGESYVLSWWDMARDAGGGPRESTPGPQEMYVVRIYDAGWNMIEQRLELPFHDEAEHTGSVEDPWSERRELIFTVPQTDWYHVTFRASMAGAPLGSVAIANVQLEDLDSGSAGASPYVGVDATRRTVSVDCAEGRAEGFRDAFAYACDADGSCFYELKHPFLIDTRHVNALTSQLVGKIAAGNYNFRHVDVGANVVGTAVLNCEGLPGNCYSDGYLEYTLQHDAYRVPLVDYGGQARAFDFGSAAIRRGKALAAERLITNPISSADQSLLSQPQFTKPELRGRPLSGSYRFRVHARPSLDWNRVEDIQLVLRYRYWSRIDN